MTALLVIGAFAVVGALAYGTLLGAILASPKKHRQALAGLLALAATFAVQNLLARMLFGDEHFAFLSIMLLFLLGMWGISLLMLAVWPSWEGLKVSLACDLMLIVPVLLSMVHSCSLP